MADVAGATLELDDGAMSHPSLAALPSIGLYGSPVTIRGLSILACRDLPELGSLSLYMSDFGPELVDVLAAAPWREGLWSLNVCGNRLGADGMRALMKLPCPRLIGLAAGYDGLGDDGALAVADARLPRLSTLNLRSNGIGARGAAALSTRYAAQLVDLGLEDNALGDEGIDALRRTPFERLQRLDVRDCGAHARSLADAPWAAKLRTLDEGETTGPSPGDGAAQWRVRLAIRPRNQPSAVERIVIGERISIGRTPGCTVELFAMNVHRVHAWLEGRGDHLAVVDNRSSNGTYHNGRKVPPEGRRVVPGDWVGVGGYQLHVLEYAPTGS